MTTQTLQATRRNAFSFLFAIFLLIAAATPTLAWTPEEVNVGQAAQTHHLTAHRVRPIPTQPTVQPAVVRAEQAFEANPPAGDLIIQLAAVQ